MSRMIALALVLPAVLSAQVIGGRVVDSASRKPVADAAVTAFDATLDTVIARAQTDTSGIFYLELRRAGTFRLKFEVVPTALTLLDSFVVAADAFIEREFMLALPADPVFFEDQLDKRATGRPESLVLRYPRDLLFGRVSGSVIVKYVISNEGRVEASSIEIVQSSNPRFAESVMYALRRLQFFPAVFHGKPVRQVVHQPFYFCMDSCSAADASPNAVSLTASRGEPVAPKPNWPRP